MFGQSVSEMWNSLKSQTASLIETVKPTAQEEALPAAVEEDVAPQQEQLPQEAEQTGSMGSSTTEEETERAVILIGTSSRQHAQ